MPKKEKPLPEPPSRPFGRKSSPEENSGAPLIADEIARAVAEGRLDEFMANSMPDNEYARKLVSMMLQMSGMSPSGDIPAQSERTSDGAPEAGAAESGETSFSPSAVPEDVLHAVNTGDVGSLIDILKKEHEKRTSSVQETVGENREGAPAEQRSGPVIEKDVIDGLIKISADNDVGIDWAILRALKLYVKDYRETGRL